MIANSPQAVKAAIDNGADPNFIPEVGDSYVHLAITKKNLAVISALLEAGARVDGENSKGETPLCTAVQERNLEAVKLFLEKGAKVNYLNARGHTAVHVAARAGFGDVLELLTGDGSVDLAVTDSSGELHYNYSVLIMLFSKFLLYFSCIKFIKDCKFIYVCLYTYRKFLLIEMYNF